MEQLDVNKIADLFPAHQRQGFLTAWRLIDALVQQPQLVEHLRTFAVHVEKSMGIAPLTGFNPVSHQDASTGNLPNAQGVSSHDAVSASAPNAGTGPQGTNVQRTGAPGSYDNVGPASATVPTNGAPGTPGSVGTRSVAPPDPAAGASATVETIDQNVGQDSPATKSPSSSRYRG